VEYTPHPALKGLTAKVFKKHGQIHQKRLLMFLKEEKIRYKRYIYTLY